MYIMYIMKELERTRICAPREGRMGAPTARSPRGWRKVGLVHGLMLG